jgi:hypothetical protein
LVWFCGVAEATPFQNNDFFSIVFTVPTLVLAGLFEAMFECGHCNCNYGQSNSNATWPLRLTSLK